MIIEPTKPPQHYDYPGTWIAGALIITGLAFLGMWRLMQLLGEVP